MSFLSSIPMSEIKDSNLRITASTAPRTAVFVGATAGIGKATLTRLVALGTPLRAYVIGRDAAKHASFLDELRAANRAAEIIFLEGQVSLLAEVKRLCEEVKAKESSLDALFLAAGFVPFGGREETSEGIELASALAYYGRMLFATLLTPLLNASPNNPRIINILAAGVETSNLLLSDLDLADPSHFTVLNVTKAGATYTTLGMSRLARENPRVVMVHNHPGGVATDIYSRGWGDHRWGKALMGLAKPLMAVGMLSPQDSGERSLYLMTSARYGGNGVPVTGEDGGGSAGRTMEGAESGGLFCVDLRFRCLQQEKIMAELEKKDAGNILWARLQEVIGPYL